MNNKTMKALQHWMGPDWWPSNDDDKFFLFVLAAWREFGGLWDEKETRRIIEEEGKWLLRNNLSISTTDITKMRGIRRETAKVKWISYFLTATKKLHPSVDEKARAKVVARYHSRASVILDFLPHIKGEGKTLVIGGKR